MQLAIVAEAELVRSLEEGGLSRNAAKELVAALGNNRRRERRPDPWMLAYAVLLTALIVGGFGWMNSRIDTLDAKTTAQILNLDAKTTAQIGNINNKIDNLDAKTTAQILNLDAKIDKTREEMIQRLTSIETIINERLPPAPR